MRQGSGEEDEVIVGGRGTDDQGGSLSGIQETFGDDVGI